MQPNLAVSESENRMKVWLIYLSSRTLAIYISKSMLLHAPSHAPTWCATSVLVPRLTKINDGLISSIRVPLKIPNRDYPQNEFHQPSQSPAGYLLLFRAQERRKITIMFGLLTVEQHNWRIDMHYQWHRRYKVGDIELKILPRSNCVKQSPCAS